MDLKQAAILERKCGSCKKVDSSVADAHNSFLAPFRRMPMQSLATRKPFFVVLSMAAGIAFLIASVMTGHILAQGPEKTPPLVVRVAVFSADQGRLDAYREFVDGHLFPTLRTVPGYVGTLLGLDTNGGQLISLSFWRSEADAAAGEEAVGRAIRSLPQGSAPRPSKVEKYVLEYRDIKEPISN
jgi:hypothetical protein